MLGIFAVETPHETISRVAAACPYCKALHRVDIVPGQKAESTVIPCFTCWDRYENNPIDVPYRLLFASNKNQANIILKQLWLDLDISEPDFRYYKQFVDRNF